MVAYAASFVPGYAVKLALTRGEVLLGRAIGELKDACASAAKLDGTFTALNGRDVLRDGAYGDSGGAVDTVAGHNCTGPYEFPRRIVDVYGWSTPIRRRRRVQRVRTPEGAVHGWR